MEPASHLSKIKEVRTRQQDCQRNTTLGVPLWVKRGTSLPRIKYNSPWANSHPLPAFVNTVLFIYILSRAAFELNSSCDRDCRGWEAENIYSLALHRKSLPSLILYNGPHNHAHTLHMLPPSRNSKKSVHFIPAIWKPSPPLSTWQKPFPTTTS